MTTAKLSDVKIVLSAPVRFSSRRKATVAAQVAQVSAKNEFQWRRATPAAWRSLVVASRRLHVLVKAERADIDAKAETIRATGAGLVKRAAGDRGTGAT